MANENKKSAFIKGLLFGGGALALVVFVSANNGAMMSLNGKNLVGDTVQVSERSRFFGQISPAAGENAETETSEVENEHNHDHEEGHHSEDDHHDDESQNFDGEELDKLGAGLKNGETVEYNGKKYVKHGDHWHEAELEYTEEPDPPSDCGIYHEWVNVEVNEEAVKNAGKEYRILEPNQPMTMDFNPERINVFINDDGIVLSVRCG